jgi:hypothetical protein
VARLLRGGKHASVRRNVVWVVVSSNIMVIAPVTSGLITMLKGMKKGPMLSCLGHGPITCVPVPSMKTNSGATRS